MWKMKIMNDFEINEKYYLWYKLCVFYHAKTEIFDRGLTDLRSPYAQLKHILIGELEVILMSTL